ncbi:MAG: ribosome maturation factor RimM [Thermomicrobiales bacterium]
MKLVIGVVVGVHGIHGEIKVRPLSDDLDPFLKLRSCYFGDESMPRQLHAIRFHQQHALIRVGGVATPEEAAAFRGMELRVAAAHLRPLEPDELFLYQVIGLEAETENGESIGRVVDLLETGATDVFVVEPTDGGAPIMLPNIAQYIVRISPESGTMVVRLPVYLD